MNSQRVIARLVGSLGALALLTGMLIGVPVALAQVVGWPLPHGIPSLAEVGDALGGQTIDDSVLVKALAVVCWLAWAQFAACVAAELAGWRRGRSPRRVPLAGGVQPMVAQLLMTVAVLTQLLPRTSTPSPVRLSTTPVVHVMEIAAPPAEEEEAPSTGVEAEPAGGQPMIYAVKPRDDLWSLAETHLGNGHRWRELFQLNEGRPQAHGGSLRRPNLIRPGWVLEFPGDAVGLDQPGREAAATPETSVPPPEIDVTKPDPTEPAEDASRRACPIPSSVVETGEPPVTPMPPTTASPATPPPLPTPQAPPEVASPEAASSPDTPERPGSGVPAGLLGAGLIAAGVVATVDQLRRAQQRRRPPGRRIRMPAPDVVPTEVAARRAASGSPAGRLDLALRAWARCAANRLAGDPPPVSTVQVGDSGIEILLTRPLDATGSPFVLSAEGQVWTLPPSVSDEELREAAGDIGAPLPALVSVGSLGSSTVLVDLEASGTTALVGDEAAVRRSFRAMALELATSTWADTLDLVVVDSDLDALRGLERVRSAASAAEILPDLEAAAAAFSDALVRVPAATTLAARLGPGAADGWVPTVVLCGDALAEPEACAQLIATAGAGGRGLVVVAAGELEGATRVLHFEENGRVHLAPPGVALSAVGPTPKQIDDVEAILTAAADSAGVEPIEPHADVTDAAILPLPGSDPGFDVLVRLLGPVEIDGTKEHIDRRRAVELVVYLATHPRGLDDEQLKTALWPDERAPQASFNTTVTKARSRLGTSEDGSHHLPHLHTTGGVYRVGPRVTTDLALLERHLATARNSPPESATRLLRSGLELVRGVPFAGVRQGYEWAYAEGLVARIETVVAETAHHLAQLALEARDPELAQWAACQGLRASEGDEVLYRDRMLACDQAGNPAGVEAVMDELVAAAEAVEPYDTLHAETVALYERLSHRRRRTG